MLNPTGTKAIFLTRDGRAVTNSNIKRTGKSSSVASKAWRFTNIYTMRLLKTLPEESYLHITYEELCRDPKKTLNTICTYIGIEFESEMLEIFGDDQHNIGGNRMRMKSDARIREDLKWRDLMSKRELSDFEKIAGNLNKQLLGSYYQP